MKIGKPTIILSLLALSVVVRVLIATQTHRAITNDEPAHWAYARWIHFNHAIPDFSMSFANTEGTQRGIYWHENYQQPAFYILAAPFVGGGVAWPRLFSLSLWLAGLVFIWDICRKWPLVLFMLLPGSALLMASITNQSLEFLGCCALVRAIHDRRDWLVMVSAIVLCLAKVTGIAACGALALYYLVKDRKRLFLLLPGLAFGAAVLWWRFPLYGSETTYWQNPVRMLACLGHAFLSGVLDPAFPMDIGNLWIGAAILLAACWWLAKRWRHFRINEYTSPILGLLAIFALFIASHTFFPGRLLYAVIPFACVSRGSVLNNQECGARAAKEET